MKRFDPGRLLRQTWANADELAKELYVFFVDNQEAMEGPQASRVNPPRIQPKSYASAAPPAVQGRDVVVVARQAVAVQDTPGRTLPYEGTPAPVAVAGISAPTRSPLATPPVSMPSGGVVQAEVEPAPLLVASVAASPLAEVASRPITLAAGPSAPTRRVLGLEQPPSPAFRRLVGDQPRQVSQPPDATNLRDLVTSVTAGMLLPAPLILAPPAPAATFLPTAGANPVVAPTAEFRSTIEAPSFALDRVEPSGSPATHRQSEEWKPKTERIPPYSFGRILAQVCDEGIPGMTLSTSSSSVSKPGKGEAYILDFDGAELYFYNKERNTVFNWSIFPVSGGEIRLLYLVGNHLFVEPPDFVHAIVSASIGSVSGTVPGTGKAKPWYKVSGTMTEGPEIDVENWYTVTAAVAKHCGLAFVDNSASLEVLDC